MWVLIFSIDINCIICRIHLCTHIFDEVIEKRRTIKFFDEKGRNLFLQEYFNPYFYKTKLEMDYFLHCKKEGEKL